MNQAWFCNKISAFSISELHQIGADNIPQEFLSNRLYYYAIFDTVYAVTDVINSMKSESKVVFCEPNFLLQPLTGVNTNDPIAANMWG